MSNKFSGVTFAKQKVTPIDSAIVQRSLLDDGILTGCDLSYAGFTVTMAGGQLLAAGRQLRHSGSESWSVADASSGYARIVLTLDLSRSSTPEAFDQAQISVQYAASASGFPALVQEDINEAGTRYQVALAVVTLSSGGVTGIAERLPVAKPRGFGADPIVLTEGVHFGTSLPQPGTYGRLFFLISGG